MSRWRRCPAPTRSNQKLSAPFPPSALREAVPPVSDSEFQSLPDYLKLMTLHKLNQAVHNINAFMADYSGMFNVDSVRSSICLINIIMKIYNIL